MKALVKLGLIGFVLFELGLLFYMFCNTPLDGDLPNIVVPAEAYRRVLTDPLAFGVLFNGDIYPAPNRFFAHWFTKQYFDHVPVTLQVFVSPIKSIYLSVGLGKMLGVFLLLGPLVYLIVGKQKFFSFQGLVIWALLVPCVLSFGPIGLIDPSITYTFFYAVPIGFLLLFLCPFREAFIDDSALGFPWWLHFILVPGTFFLALNGPLVPAVVLLAMPMGLCYLAWSGLQKNGFSWFGLRKVWQEIPKGLLFYFMVLIFLSLYSLYVGRSNSENQWASIPISERYGRLPQGFWKTVSSTWSSALLFLAVVVNGLLLYFSNKKEETGRYLGLFFWLGIFSLLYTLLLPLGGYRDYRPLIIRSDTYLPVTVVSLFLFAVSTSFLIETGRSHLDKLYWLFLSLVLGVFVFAETPWTSKAIEWRAVLCNCEQESMRQLRDTPGDVVKVPGWCSLLSWGKVKNKEDSRVKVELLRRWRVLKDEKLFYQE